MSTTTTTTTEKPNTKIYWLGFVISLILTAAFLVLLPEWFWVMLPFVGTTFIKALDWM